MTNQQEEDYSILIELVSGDDHKFEVQSKYLMMSGLLKNMLEEIEDDGEEEEDASTVPVPNVNENALQKVIEFCKHHYKNKMKAIEKPLRKDFKECVSEWDFEFIRINEEFLIELIMAANYLDLKDMLELGCAKVASMLKGKTAQQIREMFGIENDFSEEEESKIKEENNWCTEV